MKLSIGGLVVTFLVVLACIYAYNAFVAKPGDSIASLGVPKK